MQSEVGKLCLCFQISHRRVLYNAGALHASGMSEYWSDFRTAARKEWTIDDMESGLFKEQIEGERLIRVLFLHITKERTMLLLVTPCPHMSNI